MSKEIGTKREVYEEKAQKTKQGLTKDDLTINAKGNVVKKKKTRQAPSGNRPKKTNAWIEHLREFRKNNPQFSYKEAMKKAKETYKKGQPAQAPAPAPAQEEKKEPTQAPAPRARAKPTSRGTRFKKNGFLNINDD